MDLVPLLNDFVLQINYHWILNDVVVESVGQILFRSFRVNLWFENTAETVHPSSKAMSAVQDVLREPF